MTGWMWRRCSWAEGARLGLPHDVPLTTLWLLHPAVRLSDCAGLRFRLRESGDAACALPASACEGQDPQCGAAWQQCRRALYDAGTDDGRSAYYGACDGEPVPRGGGWTVRRDKQFSRKSEDCRGGGVGRCAACGLEHGDSAAADVSRGVVQCGWA